MQYTTAWICTGCRPLDILGEHRCQLTVKVHVHTAWFTEPCQCDVSPSCAGWRPVYAHGPVTL